MRVAAFVFAIAFMLTRTAAGEPTVSARDGNIFIRDDSGEERQLTSSGRDSSPVLDPARKWVVFVRSIEGKPILTGNDPDGYPPAELWQIAVNGKEPTRFVRTRNAEKPEDIIAAFEDVQFSSDGRLVYFISPAWATSGAVHVVDTTNGRERFLLAGNEFEVIHFGKYRDHLLVNQHRYFVGPGSFDWFWLFQPDGKEVGPVGEETEDFKSLHVTDERSAERP